MDTFLFTSESVNEGHPDKICDQVSDAILDACLEQNPESKVACETCTKTNMVMGFGEITTKAKVDYEKIVRDTCRGIRFTSPNVGLDADNCKVLVNIEQQSPDITQGVHGHLAKKPEEISTGDQRLHFCEITDLIVKINQRMFSIYIGNRTAESQADVAGWAGGNLKPLYKNYVVSVPNGSPQQDLCFALHPYMAQQSQYYNAILNGLEIFKVNDSTSNLAGPNPLPAPKQPMVDPSPVKKQGSAKTNTTGSYASSLPSNLCRHFSFAEIKSATKNFNDTLLLGVGGFGKVYKGEIDGSATKVATKRANPLSKQGVHEFPTEIEMLSKLRHWP
ncbi:hypothetical protein MLD38_033531 [Melastoma candidum]|uniref:Uncharacterized protein n=1 Tax=Melastoma candidum TaxID=119954 RepID=A0ACB9M7I7_9MYRT|nr:hypothetical protein MLD38_033531 [Melastoma candidum]